jgi:hypothetical protein
MAHIDCPYCGHLGTVTGERVIKAVAALTTYFCDACHSEWDERDDERGQRVGLRSRPPKTRRDKQAEE